VITRAAPAAALVVSSQQRRSEIVGSFFPVCLLIGHLRYVSWQRLLTWPVANPTCCFPLSVALRQCGKQLNNHVLFTTKVYTMTMLDKLLFSKTAKTSKDKAEQAGPRHIEVHRRP
jgi:hypothetical protein